MVNELKLVTNHVSSTWTNYLLLFWTKIAGSQGNVLMGRRSIVVYFELCQNLQPEPNHMMDNTDWNTKNSRKIFVLDWHEKYFNVKNISERVTAGQQLDVTWRRSSSEHHSGSCLDNIFYHNNTLSILTQYWTTS